MRLGVLLDRLGELGPRHALRSSQARAAASRAGERAEQRGGRAGQRVRQARGGPVPRDPAPAAPRPASEPTGSCRSRTRAARAHGGRRGPGRRPRGAPQSAPRSGPRPRRVRPHGAPLRRGPRRTRAELRAAPRAGRRDRRAPRGLRAALRGVDARPRVPASPPRAPARGARPPGPRARQRRLGRGAHGHPSARAGRAGRLRRRRRGARAAGRRVAAGLAGRGGCVGGQDAGDTHPAALSAGVFADAAAPDAAARCKRALQAWAALCPPGSAGDLALQAAASAASASGGDCLDLLEGCLAECEAGAGRASATAMRWAAQAAPVALFHAGAAGTEWAARLAKMGRKAVQGRNAEPLGQALLESAAYAACGADTTRSVSFLLDALERELRAMREPGLQANGSLLTAEALRRKAATCCFGTRSEAFSCVKEADDVAARAAGPTSAARMATAWMLLAHVLPPEGFPRRNAGDTLRKIMELAVDLFDELIKAGGEDTPYAAALLAVAGRVLQCSSSADADASFKAALRCTSVSAAKGAYIVAPAVGMGPATPADIEAIVHAWQREGAPALDAPLSPPAALALPGRSNGHATFTAALAFFSANASADNIARAPPLQSHDLFLEHSAPASRPMSASSSQRPSCRPASVTDAAVVADSPRSLAGGVASAARFHMGVSLRSGSRSPAQSWHPGPLRCPSGATTDVLSGPPTRSAHEVDSGGDVCLAGKRAGLSDSPRSMSNAEEMSAKVKTALEGNIPLLHAAS
ncbi:unnamed protein product [Pedinophyceae sp. YPF-701]|nr:unnamed protein product [Pedinophyceae sp. YPF-701]